MKKAIMMIAAVILVLGAAACAQKQNCDDIIGGADSSTGILVTDGSASSSDTDIDKERPDEPEAVEPASIDAEYTMNNDEYCTYYITLTALDESGNVMWTYRGADCMVGQCESTQLLGMNDGQVYVSETGIYEEGEEPQWGCRLRALNAADGTVLWDNEEFTGTGATAVFDEAGNIYACGYFGPDCMKIDRSGKTLWEVPSIDEDLFWVYDLSYENGEITLYYEMSPNGEPAEVKLTADGALAE
jgi:outer membrane protein assembly factor BamB